MGHLIVARAPRGEANGPVRVTDPERLAPFLEDAAHVPGGHAAALVVPRTERDVAEALRTSTSLLVVGAQSSLTGGATPRGDTVLSTRAFADLRWTGADRLRAGAGVTLTRIEEFLEPAGAFYPPAPTYTGATLGGTIATNAAGAATFKYGTTRSWIEAITVVLPGGDVLDVQRGQTFAHPDGYFDVALGRGVARVPVPTYRMPGTPKLSAGYFAAQGMDLIDLFIGAEGTLGVIVEATIRTRAPRPAHCLVFLTLRDRRTALSLVTRVREAAVATRRSGQHRGLDVSAIEHMDARSLALLREDGVPATLGIQLDADAAMGLLITLDLPPGTTAAEVYDAFGSAEGTHTETTALAAFCRLLDNHGALTAAIVAPPGDSGATARLLALREAVPMAVNQRVGRAQRSVDPRIEKTAADVVVPFERFELMLDLYERELVRRGLDAAIWGHISDGNVHPNILPRSFEDVESGREAMLAFGREAIRLGGAPLAEHGVGRNATKQRLLADLYGERGIEAMRAVKRALDPEWMLAPGVIFTRD